MYQYNKVSSTAMKSSHFYSASALLAMETTIIAMADLSVCPSVRMSVRHVSVFCPDE